MLKLGLGEGPLRVLAIGSHADDIEIGCGGTLLRLAQERPALELHWVVLSAAGERADEARASAEAFGAEVDVQGFRDAFFRYGPEVKEYFESLKPLAPDVIFTHHDADRHQDHRLVAELTWNTFRDHLILEYEIPKYDGDLGTPNVFFALDEEVAARKVELLLESFPSQAGKRWFTEDLFLALMRLRGMECNARLAEAFYYARKVSL
jgi:LmbE family N-acetylglucosaminyl deacetylase